MFIKDNENLKIRFFYAAVLYYIKVRLFLLN